MKNKKQGPVLQTNTQQLKKEIFQETVANLASSDESEEKKEWRNASSHVLDISDHKDRTVRTQVSHIGAAFQNSELVRQTEESAAGLSQASCLNFRTNQRKNTASVQMSQRSRLEKLEKKLDIKSNSSGEQLEVTDEEGPSAGSQKPADTPVGVQKTSEDLKEEYYRLARQLEILKKTKSPVQQRNSEKPEAQKLNKHLQKTKGKQTQEEIRLQGSQMQNQSSGRYQAITHSVSVEEELPRHDRRQQQRGVLQQRSHQQNLFQHSQ